MPISKGNWNNFLLYLQNRLFKVLKRLEEKEQQLFEWVKITLCKVGFFDQS